MKTDELIIVEVFCQEYQIEINFIDELESFGLIQTIALNNNKYLNINQLAEIEKIIRLHNDLNINKEGIEVVLDLLEKVNQLNKQIKHLNNKLGLYE